MQHFMQIYLEHSKARKLPGKLLLKHNGGQCNFVNFTSYDQFYQIHDKVSDKSNIQEILAILSRRFALLAPKDILICFWLSNLLTLIIGMACHICGKHLHDHIISLMCIDFCPFYDFNVWFWYCSYRMVFLFFILSCLAYYRHTSSTLKSNIYSFI